MKYFGLQELFIEHLRDFYGAERLILQTLPLLVEAAVEEDVKRVLNQHAALVREQVERLERVFENLGEAPSGEAGPAVRGLLEEGTLSASRPYHEDTVRDTALILAARKIEHYEIACYGSLVSLADQLNDGKTLQLLSGQESILSIV